MAIAVPDDPQPEPGPVRAWLERVPDLPTRHRLLADVAWYATAGRRKLVAAFIRLPRTLLAELRPIGAGFERIVAGWVSWVRAAEYAATIALVAKSGPVDKHDADRLERRRESRRTLSLVGAAAGAGGVIWSWLLRPDLLIYVGVGLVLLADAVGRRGGARPDPAPPTTPVSLLADPRVPLSKVTAGIVECLADRWSVPVTISRPMSYDPARMQFELWVGAADEITTAMLRDLERALGAADKSARSLAPPDGVASVRRLVIRNGDPLADPVPRPFVPTGSRSGGQPVLLGVSCTEIPFEIDPLQHLRFVARTGGGKTKWFMRSAIDAISADRDIGLLGIDITRGPEMPMWRGVFQRTAYTPEQADRLLDEILAEVERRTGILHAIAADDNPDNDADEWHPGLGAPYWIVKCDEYPQIARYDGKQGRPDLQGKVETIIRTSRKTGIFLHLYAQKSGNSDLGSSVIATQVNGTIVGPCDEADTVRLLGVDRRDQGYLPHLLAPGTPDAPNDAGKCYLDTSRHTTPDEYRAFSPGTNAEVKRRAAQRMADGLPPLYGGPGFADHRGDDDAVDAVEVPPLLAAVEQVFSAAGRPVRIPTAEILTALAGLGFDDHDENTLAAGLRPHGLRPDRWRPGGGRGSIRGYLLADVDTALRGFG